MHQLYKSIALTNIPVCKFPMLEACANASLLEADFWIYAHSDCGTNGANRKIST